MIRIEVEEYCHACLDFSPDVTKPTREVAYIHDPLEFLPKETVIQSDTIVQCEYRRRCEAIKKYLIRQATEETEAVG